MKHMLHNDPTKSLSTISFRGSSEDKKIMEEYAAKLQCSPSAVIRLALRLLKEINTSTFIPELLHRVHVYNVMHSGRNVVRFEPVSEIISEYINEEYIAQFDSVLKNILPDQPPDQAAEEEG